MKAFALVLLSLFAALPARAAEPHPPPFDDVQMLLDVYRRIRTQHVSTNPSDEELYYGLIRGMVESLGDRHSRFLPPAEATGTRETSSGSYGGVGVTVVADMRGALVTAVAMEGPAAKAGIRAGDVILAIDGRRIGRNDNVHVILRGKAGTVVELRVRRDGSPPFVAKARRVTYASPSLRWRVARYGPRSVLLVDIDRFGDDTGDLFDEAARAAVRERVHGIVVDLRGNGGGRLDMAGRVACRWIGRGRTYAVQRAADGASAYSTCGGDAMLAGIPTVVLADRQSASASEVVAGALQDYGQASVVGTQTVGKGVGQNVHDFPDGSRLLLVAFEWFTPSGRTVNDVGITPDVRVDPATRPGTDPQLQAALRVIFARRP